jgi:hypothetical protein
MTAMVFLGPSLDIETARGELDAIYLPPVSQGDVYRAATRQPDAIGIIDGRFQDVPAVWHKEILWALNQGIPVYGSSSMGALRAAELDSFGMVGIGAIYRAYRDGVLEDDDEVAVAHRTAEEGFAPTSEPMVDIRWTLEAAELAGVIDDQVAMRLTHIAKQQFYPERSYRSLITIVRRDGLADTRQLDDLEAWLVGNQVHQKRADALALLRAVRTGPPPAPVPFAFEHTQFFERARRSAGTVALAERATTAVDPTTGTVGSPPPASTVTLEALLDELKLQPDLYHELKLRAVARCLAARERARDTRRSESDLQIALDRFRRSHDLAQPAATREWMVENEVSLSQLAALAQEDAALSDATTQLEGELDIYLRNELRSRDLYAALAERARDKQHVLGRLGAADASFDQVDDDEVVQWHFQSIGTPTPSDLSAYMRGLGYSDPVVFLRTLKREYSYQYGSLAASDGSSPQPRVGRPAHD